MISKLFHSHSDCISFLCWVFRYHSREIKNIYLTNIVYWCSLGLRKKKWKSWFKGSYNRIFKYLLSFTNAEKTNRIEMCFLYDFIWVIPNDSSSVWNQCNIPLIYLMKIYSNFFIESCIKCLLVWFLSLLKFHPICELKPMSFSSNVI